MLLTFCIFSFVNAFASAAHVSVISSIPATWWEKYPNNKLDWTRPLTFQRLGYAVRSLAPQDVVSNVLSGAGMSLLSQGPDETSGSGCIVSSWMKGGEGCWSRRAAYFPMKARATVIAVSTADQFKGWEYWLSQGSWQWQNGNSNPTQFVVLDETFTIYGDGDTSQQNVNGFYFVPIQEGGRRPHQWPHNWVAPNNFKDGMMFIRVELYDQPTSATSALQFCIWQDNFHREACAPFWPAPLTGPADHQFVPPTPWEEQECAADWQDCRTGKCCATQNFVCVEQAQGGYAQCRDVQVGCPGDWSCNKLAMPIRPLQRKTDTVADLLASTPEVSTFYQLAETAGVTDQLVDPENTFTVFAPSNAAMEKMDPRIKAAIQRDLQPMRAFVWQHISVPSHAAQNLVGKELHTFTKGGHLVITKNDITLKEVEGEEEPSLVDSLTKEDKVVMVKDDAADEEDEEHVNQMEEDDQEDEEEQSAAPAEVTTEAPSVEDSDEVVELSDLPKTVRKNRKWKVSRRTTPRFYGSQPRNLQAEDDEVDILEDDEELELEEDDLEMLQDVDVIEVNEQTQDEKTEDEETEDEEDEDMEKDMKEEDMEGEDMEDEVMEDEGSSESAMSGSDSLEFGPFVASFVSGYTNLKADNGYIHVIDAAFVPTGTRSFVDPLPIGMNRLTECMDDFQTCTEAKCCKDVTSACLSKDAYYAQCIPQSSPCPPDGEEWECASLTITAKEYEALKEDKFWEKLAQLQDEENAPEEKVDHTQGEGEVGETESSARRLLSETAAATTNIVLGCGIVALAIALLVVTGRHLRSTKQVNPQPIWSTLHPPSSQDVPLKSPVYTESNHTTHPVLPVSL